MLRMNRLTSAIPNLYKLMRVMYPSFPELCSGRFSVGTVTPGSKCVCVVQHTRTAPVLLLIDAILMQTRLTSIWYINETGTRVAQERL